MNSQITQLDLHTGQTLLQTNNFSELIKQLGVEEQALIDAVYKFYEEVADNNHYFILKKNKEQITEIIKSGNAFIVVELKDTEYEVVGFAKVSAYYTKVENNKVGECESDVAGANPIVEIGNLMSHVNIAGHGLGTKNVIKCLELVQNKYLSQGFWPIAVVNSKNKPSLAIFRKLVHLGFAVELSVWPDIVEHSEHDGIYLDDSEEICFDLANTMIENNLELIKLLLAQIEAAKLNEQ